MLAILSRVILTSIKQTFALCFAALAAMPSLALLLHATGFESESRDVLFLFARIVFFPHLG